MERDLPLGRAGSNGILLNGTYQFIRNLGHGAFGKVKVARHLPTGCKVAIKILNRRKIREKEIEDKKKGITTFGMEKVAREITISKMLVHPHIVRVYEVIETQTDIYVVMEYAERGELFDYIVMNRRVQEDEARKFFQQIISGLECCHSYRVVHRDLKPENLLLDCNGNLKIADFGLSNIMQDGHFLRTCCGSPNYAAPEVISGRPYAGPEIDVWSCGVILYALLAGTLPFDDESIPNLYNKIKQGIYTLPSHLSPGAKDLIARMLVVDPLKRITIPEIRTHSWFKTNLLGYLAVPCLDAVTSQMRKLNEEILLRVITMGHDQNFLVHSLQNKIHNDGTVSYYLLLDNYYRSNNCYIVELESAGEPHSAAAAAAAHVGESSQSSTTHQIGRAVNQQGIDLVPHTQSDGRWNLGLRFGAHPHQVMAIVLQTLQNLNVGWKKIGHYNMKCRWSPKSHFDLDLNLNLNGHFQDTVALLSNSYSSSDMLIDNVPQNTVKFELQLYKTLSENYLLDLQRIMGPQLLFLDLCTNFLAQLQLI